MGHVLEVADVSQHGENGLDHHRVPWYREKGRR